MVRGMNTLQLASISREIGAAWSRSLYKAPKKQPIIERLSELRLLLLLQF